MSIERVGVVGGGQMGGGIAEVCAKAGADVLVFEPTDELAGASEKRVTASLERAKSKGKLSADDFEVTVARLRFTTNMADLADRQLVIEAIVEPVLVIVDSRVALANRAARRLLGEHIVGEDARTAIRHPAAAERLAREPAVIVFRLRKA